MRTRETDRGTRRGWWRYLAAALAVLLVATACGGDDDGGDTATDGAADAGDTTDDGTTEGTTDDGGTDGEVDPEGVLRYGTELTVLGGNRALDPMESRSVGDFLHLQLIYDTLLRVQADGTYEPGLAEDFQVQGDNAITLTLREGLTFHDGSALDAEAVKFSIERNIAAENRNHAPLINVIESVEAPDARTVVITLSEPQIGAFFELLGGRETMPVSPTAAEAGNLNEEPVGAGPYQLESFQPEQLLSLRRFDDHWEADAWQLGGVDFVQAPSGPPRVNVLLSDQADMIELNADQVTDLEGQSGVTVQPTTSNANFIYLATCKNQEPFDNLAFREAVAYALDRDVFNETLLFGQGEPMWTMWPQDSAYFTEELDGRFAHDPDMARQKLEEAGWTEGDTLEMAIPAGLSVLERGAEIVQSQLGEVGINVEIVPTQDIVADFYQNVQQPFALSFWIRPGLQKITRAFGPDSVANVCSYDDPELNALADQIAALPPDDPEVAELWDQVNTFVTDNVLWNMIVWQPLVHAWQDGRVGGVDAIYPEIQGPDFRSIFIRQ